MRPATHAGSWYEGRADQLAAVVKRYMQATTSNRSEQLAAVKAALSDASKPRAIRGVIGPHAGLRFSGPTAGVAYNVLHAELAKARGPSERNPYAGLKRVILIGPSHREYFRGIGVSGFDAYDTPFGALRVDREASDAIVASLSSRSNDDGAVKRFFSSSKASSAVPAHVLKRETEEAEHSLELHTPFIAMALRDRANAPAPPKPFVSDVALVPIVVGDVSEAEQQRLGDTLRGYMLPRDAAPGVVESLVVVSSDFCHWGSRFRFQHLFRPEEHAGSRAPHSWVEPSASTFDYAGQSGNLSVGDRIEVMDHHGIAIAERLDVPAWTSYLAATKNTICGARPIAAALHALGSGSGGGGGAAGDDALVRFVHYDQSSRCASQQDSSVSYASALFVA